MSERTWTSIMCLLFGHSWVTHTKYRLENDLGRVRYGKLCAWCGRFQPDRSARPETNGGED